MFSRLPNRRLPAYFAGLGLLLLLLGACGQKGPLYMPEETDQEQTEANTDSNSS